MDVVTYVAARSYIDKCFGGGTGSGGNTSNVQPDWNQNNSSALDYVKNRPFYSKDSVEVVLCQNQTADFNNNYNVGLFDAINLQSLLPNQQYHIKINEETFVLQSKVLDDTVFLGNLSILDSNEVDTGESFFIAPFGGTQLGIINKEQLSQCVISITGYIVENIKLDVKYIPTIPEKLLDKSIGILKVVRPTEDGGTSGKAESIGSVWITSKELIKNRGYDNTGEVYYDEKKHGFVCNALFSKYTIEKSCFCFKYGSPTLPASVGETIKLEIKLINDKDPLYERQKFGINELTEISLYKFTENDGSYLSGTFYTRNGLYAVISDTITEDTTDSFLTIKKLI